MSAEASSVSSSRVSVRASPPAAASPPVPDVVARQSGRPDERVGDAEISPDPSGSCAWEPFVPAAGAAPEPFRRERPPRDPLLVFFAFFSAAASVAGCSADSSTSACTSVSPAGEPDVVLDAARFARPPAEAFCAADAALASENAFAPALDFDPELVFDAETASAPAAFFAFPFDGFFASATAASDSVAPFDSAAAFAFEPAFDFAFSFASEPALDFGFASEPSLAAKTASAATAFFAFAFPFDGFFASATTASDSVAPFDSAAAFAFAPEPAFDSAFEPAFDFAFDFGFEAGFALGVFPGSTAS